MREKAIKIKRKRCASDWFLDIFKVVFLVLVTVICVYPFWNIFVVSINDATDALRGGLYFLPRKLSLASYKDILGRATFLHGILITVLRTAIGTPLAVLVTTALAYVLSRKELLFRKQLNLFFIFTMYFGGGMVPYYMVLKSLGMLNNFIVFIFPNLVSVYNMILVKNYIEGMPAEIFESAKIDGAGEYTIFFKMVLPLSKPVISALGIFTAVGTWNDYTQTLYYTKSADIQTLSYYMLSITKASASAASLGETMSAGASSVLTTMSNSAANYKTIELACMVLSALPLIIVYPFAQKFFEKGVMVGSVKG